MAHELWCGDECAGCEKRCDVNESMPCLPNCEHLLANGGRNVAACTSCEWNVYEQENNGDTVIVFSDTYCRKDRCPSCRSNCISHGEPAYAGDVSSRDWSCNRCGASGVEVSKLVFSHYRVNVSN